jgi:hypothetical protein
MAELSCMYYKFILWEQIFVARINIYQKLNVGVYKTYNLLSYQIKWRKQWQCVVKKKKK